MASSSLKKSIDFSHYIYYNALEEEGRLDAGPLVTCRLFYHNLAEKSEEI